MALQITQILGGLIASHTRELTLTFLSADNIILILESVRAYKKHLAALHAFSEQEIKR